MKLQNIFIGTLLLAFSSGCTHLASVSTTTVPAKRTNAVHAEGSRFIFLGFNFDNEYVNNIVADLAQQCPNGKVQGILTKHENIVYFPLFAHKVRVSADGYCLQPSRKRQRPRRASAQEPSGGQS